MSLSRKPALAAACLAIAGGGSAAFAVADAGANTVTPVSPSAAHVHAAPTGTGTLTVTGAKGKSHTRDLAISCKRVGDREIVRGTAKRTAGSSTTAKGKHHGKRSGGLSVALTIPDAGSASPTGTLLITRHHGASFSGHRYRKVPVTLNANGGSATFSKTLSGKRHAALKGKTISVSTSWTCSD